MRWVGQRRRAFLLGTILLAASACVGGGGGGGGGGSIDIDHLASELIGKLCEGQVACGKYPDRESCEESQTFQMNQIVADVKAGLIEYDGAKARECQNMRPVVGCSIFDSIGRKYLSCDAAFVGTIPLGGSCFSDESCAGRASCNDFDDRTCTAGVCIAKAEKGPVGEGQSCAEDYCEDGLRCDDDSKLCLPRISPDTACASFDDCVKGYVCDLDPDSTPGTCVKVPTTGETCDPDLGGELHLGLYSCLKSADFCDPIDMTCKPKLAVGSACGDGLTPLFVCVQYAACIDGTCVARPTLGDSCPVTTKRLFCLGSLYCENGTCIDEPQFDICSFEPTN